MSSAQPNIISYTSTLSQGVHGYTLIDTQSNPQNQDYHPLQKRECFSCYLLFLSFEFGSFLLLFFLHLFQLLCKEFISIHPLQVLSMCAWGVGVGICVYMHVCM